MYRNTSKIRLNINLFIYRMSYCYEVPVAHDAIVDRNDYFHPGVLNIFYLSYIAAAQGDIDPISFKTPIMVVYKTV